MVATLQKDLHEKQNVVDEKEEELYELRDKLEEMVDSCACFSSINHAVVNVLVHPCYLQL